MENRNCSDDHICETKISLALKVSGSTDPKKLAGAICKGLEENGGKIAVQAIGAAAVSQAVKGIAIARAMSEPEGADLKVVPGFKDVEVNGRKVTAIQLRVLRR